MPIITETVGDIFAAPTDSILIHACNAKGAWGSGVALEFKKRYPQAFKTYTTHCKSPSKGTPIAIYQRSLAGTCLLIPPSSSPDPKTPRHYIACLITSVGYGKNVDEPDTILQNTASAARDLKAQIAGLRGEEWDGEVWAVRINSGRFGVEWGRTRAILEGGEVDMRVVAPEGEGGGEEGGDGDGKGVDTAVVRSKAEGEKGMDDREETRDSEGDAKGRDDVGDGESGRGKMARVVNGEVNIKGVDTTVKPKTGRRKRARAENWSDRDGDNARAIARPKKRRWGRVL